MPTVPRPQATRSRQVILDAARSLIEEEGAAAVTHQRVAARAGVGRATVYRHWPDGADLLIDALANTRLHFLEPAEGTLVERVRADLRRVADELNQEGLVSLAATIVDRSRWDDRTRQLRERLMADVIDNTRTALAEAHEAGELGERTEIPDPDELLCDLIGPLWVRSMLQGQQITEAFVDRVVAQVLPTTP